MRTKEEILKEIDRLKEWIESAEKELEVVNHPIHRETVKSATYEWNRQIDVLTKELESFPKDFTSTIKMSSEEVEKMIKSIRETPIQIVPSQSNPTEIIKEHVAAINEQIRLISANGNVSIEAAIKQKVKHALSITIKTSTPYLEIKITEII